METTFVYSSFLTFSSVPFSLVCMIVSQEKKIVNYKNGKLIWWLLKEMVLLYMVLPSTFGYISECNAGN